MKAGIYIHIPFCLGKCRYCSFNSVPYKEDIARRYLEALKAEISACPHDIEPTSLYIGGGTPTALPMDGLLSVLDAVRARFTLREGMEATVEANPGTLPGLELKRLRGAGINRVSLGAQSFRPEELKMLGRLHKAHDIGLAVERLRGAGIGNIGLDLIYSLPGQDIAGWVSNVEAALTLSPAHLSIYDLTLEEGTPLHAEVTAGRLTMPPEEVQVEMYLKAVEVLEGAGYIRYEVSNFARPGYECVHNINYWSAGEYAGFGAGAYSCLNGTRSKDMDDVESYTRLAAAGVSAAETTETLTPVELEREYVMLGLRKAGGISQDDYYRRFGHGFIERNRASVDMLVGAGLIDVSGGRIRLTMNGVLRTNAVTREFF